VLNQDFFHNRDVRIAELLSYKRSSGCGDESGHRISQRGGLFRVRTVYETYSDKESYYKNYQNYSDKQASSDLQSFDGFGALWSI